MPVSVRAALAILAAFALSACRGAGAGDCSSKSCPSGQTCDLSTHLCMVAPPPGVHVDISTPKPDSVLVGTNAILSGDVLENGQPLHSVKYTVDDGGSWATLDAGLSGHFDAVIDLPTANGQPFAITVQATGTSGTSSSTVTPTVDNIAPQASFPVADGGRLAPRDFQIAFSEPVLPQGTSPVFAVSPDAGSVVWSADRMTAEFASLAPDTLYTVTLLPDSVRDLAGNNASNPGSIHFRTEPATPVSGSIIDLGSEWTLAGFDAKSNADGIVTMSMWVKDQTGAQKFLWGRFDPQTGVFRAQDAQPLAANAGVGPFHVATYVGAAAEDEPTRGFEVRYSDDAGTHHSIYFSLPDGGTGQDIANAYALIPTGPGCGEPGVGPIGELHYSGSSDNYVRGSTSIAIPFDPNLEVIHSPDDWELLSLSGPDLVRLRHVCDCQSLTCALEPDAGTSVVALNVDPTKPVFAAAAETGDRIYAYTHQGGLDGQECVQVDGTKLGGSVDGTQLVVASEHSGSKVLGAWTRNGAVELLERDLTSPCTSSWQVLGQVTTVASDYRPVKFGSRPGLIYWPIGSNQLDVYVP